MNIDLYLAKLKSLEAKATPGPWMINYSDFDGHGLLDSEGAFIVNKGLTLSDANLIVESQSAIPQLISIIEKQKEALEHCNHSLGPCETIDKALGHEIPE